MKVSELTGKKLASWVGKAQKWRRLTHDYWVNENGTGVVVGRPYRPDVLGDQAFDLIEKFDIWLSSDSYDMNRADWWVASTMDTHVAAEGWENQTGATPQEAICRAVVASVYGEEVSDE